MADGSFSKVDRRLITLGIPREGWEGYFSCNTVQISRILHWNNWGEKSPRSGNPRTTILHGLCYPQKPEHRAILITEVSSQTLNKWCTTTTNKTQKSVALTTRPTPATTTNRTTHTINTTHQQLKHHKNEVFFLYPSALSNMRWLEEKN